MGMDAPLIYKDMFGIAYQVIGGYTGKPHPAATAQPFFHVADTVRFLHGLRVPHGHWRRVLVSQPLVGGLHYMDEHTVLYEIAQLIVRRRIRVYELPRFKQSALHNKAGQAFCFYKGPEHYPGIETRPRFFPNRQDADTFVATLDAKSAFWHKCLHDNGVLLDNVNPQKTSDTEYRNIVSELLVSRQLLLYKTNDAPPPPKGEQATESVSADEPGNRKAHLIVPTGPAHAVDANQVKTAREEACAELDKCEVGDEEAAQKAGMAPEHMQAVKKTCGRNNATVSFRDTNPACLPHIQAGVPSKGSEVKQKTFKAECLPDDKMHLAGLVSNLDRMPSNGSVLSGKDLEPFITNEGTFLTGDYDMHEMMDATTGERIVGESKRDLDLRDALNDSMGEPDRIKHGAQANYMDYCKKKNIDPDTHLLQPDPPVTVIDGKQPVTVYRLENDEQLLNMYNCKGTEVPENWSFTQRQDRT